MIDALLDTNIVIDILRKYPLAISWSHENKDLRFALPSIVWLEVIQGARNVHHQKMALALLNDFSIIPFTEHDDFWVRQKIVQFHLPHSNIGILDMQIAAIAARTQLPFYTRNIKHFAPFDDVQTIVPY